MESVFRAAVEEAKTGDDHVIATVVRTSGSTPQKAGAKLLVRKDGSGVGTLGGGCVEGDIWFAARQLLKRGGDAEMRDYELNEELAAQDGLVCGGTMYFLIDPVRSTDGENSYGEFANEVVEAYEGGAPVAIVNIMVAPDGADVSVGNKMLVRENGSTSGSLGDEKLDSASAQQARQLMALGKNDYVVTDSGVEYYIEAYTTPPTLVVAGGGHVSKALAPVAKSVGFRLFILDDREEFANKDRFPEADIVQVGDYESGLESLPINANSFIVIATRGHRYDDAALASALKTPASYVGLLGSKRKTILIYEALLNRGFSLDDIRRTRSPIGLDIGARTPEEIAISVMGEILMFRLGGGGGVLKLDERLIQAAVRKAAKAQEPVTAD